MSTAVSPSGEYAECDEFIDYQIQIARDRIRWTDLLTALLLAAVLLIGYVLLFTICDHWIVPGGFAPVTRATMLGVVVVLCGAIVYRFVVRPWTREIHPLYAARMLDDSHSEMEGALMSLVDVTTSGTVTPASIRRAMEKRAAVRLSEVNLDQAIERRWLMRLGGILFLLVVLVCLYVVISPKSINLLRPLSLSNAAVATRTRILKVAPGNVVVPAGTELEVVVDISGKLPDDVTVIYSTRDQRFVDEKLAMHATEDHGRFRVLMLGDGERGLRQSLTYQVIAGDATSDLFHVTVDQPPTANVTQLSYSYPDYMALPPRTSEDGNIDAWEDSIIELTAEANVPVAAARLVFSDDPTFDTPAEEVPLTITGKELFGRFPVELREDGTSPGFYQIQLEDQKGQIDPRPTVYSVNVRPDQPPIVKLLDPIRDLRVPANAVVSLLAQAEDPDFLLRSVKLKIEVNAEPRSDELLFDATRNGLRKSWSGQWDFRLEPLGLQQGDVVKYHLTARDNNPPLGRQSRTGTLQFDVGPPASIKEVHERLQQDKELQDQQRRELEQDDRISDPSKTNPSDVADSPSNKPVGSDSAESSDGEAGGNAVNEGDGPGDGRRDDATHSDPGSRKDPGDSVPSGSEGTESEDESASDKQGGGSATQEPDTPVSDDEALQKILQRYQETAAEQQDGETQDASSEELSDEGDNGRDETATDAPDVSKPFDDASTGIDQKIEPDDTEAGSEQGEQTPSAGPQSSDPEMTEQAAQNSDVESSDRNVEPAANNGDTREPNTVEQPSNDGLEDQPTDPDGPNDEGMNDLEGQPAERNENSGDVQEQPGKERGQQGEQGGQQG
ncbi:MAG: hypothetical protein GY826_43245 [Fuerstiella sp.]|nr:hypothetical protein [Fuerstiella sp.]